MCSCGCGTCDITKPSLTKETFISLMKEGVRRALLEIEESDELLSFYHDGELKSGYLVGRDNGLLEIQVENGDSVVVSEKLLVDNSSTGLDSQDSVTRKLVRTQTSFKRDPKTTGSKIFWETLSKQIRNIKREDYPEYFSKHSDGIVDKFFYILDYTGIPDNGLDPMELVDALKNEMPDSLDAVEALNIW